eukprot:SAG31_NODE_1815_length_7210_cov_7.167628_3_plen_54_part_00
MVEFFMGSFMWTDPRGNYHALFHTITPNRGVGGHAYSADGLHVRFWHQALNLC